MSFLTHRWVRGENFWGREEILSSLQKRLNRFTWILGNRRVGKTSLLRQIELLCTENDWGVSPLYLDFQGAGDDEGLKMAFLEAFDEKEEYVEALNLDLDDLENRTLSNFLFQIKRSLKRSDINMLFLIDEAEELVDISQSNPQVLSILRKFFHGDRKMSVFITASYVLHEVEEPSRTSQFIQEFLPPVALYPFTQEETLGFLKSKGIAPQEHNRIFNTSAGNPYLVQNLAEKTEEKGFQAALDELIHSKFFKYFFDSNFNCLPQSIREKMEGENPGTFFNHLEPTPETHTYLIQSSILIENSEGSTPHPLLSRVYGSPELMMSPASAELKSEQPEGRMIFFFQMAECLANRGQALSALLLPGDPTDLLLDRNRIEDCQEPPSMEMLQLSDEKSLFQILLWACPEYIHGEKADQRSMVYLAGLLLEFCLFERQPHTNLPSLEERIQAILHPFSLNRALLEQKNIDPRMGMVLLKAMTPDRTLRYASIEIMLRDIRHILNITSN